MRNQGRTGQNRKRGRGPGHTGMNALKAPVSEQGNSDAYPKGERPKRGLDLKWAGLCLGEVTSAAAMRTLCLHQERPRREVHAFFLRSLSVSKLRQGARHGAE